MSEAKTADELIEWIDENVSHVFECAKLSDDSVALIRVSACNDNPMYFGGLHEHGWKCGLYKHEDDGSLVVVVKDQ